MASLSCGEPIWARSGGNEVFNQLGKMAGGSSSDSTSGFIESWIYLNRVPNILSRSGGIRGMNIADHSLLQL